MISPFWVIPDARRTFSRRGGACVHLLARRPPLLRALRLGAQPPGISSPSQRSCGSFRCIGRGEGGREVWARHWSYARAACVREGVPRRACCFHRIWPGAYPLCSEAAVRTCAQTQVCSADASAPGPVSAAAVAPSGLAGAPAGTDGDASSQTSGPQASAPSPLAESGEAAADSNAASRLPASTLALGPTLAAVCGVAMWLR